MEFLKDGELNIERHRYTSNWTVGAYRYDVMLGMPWHATCKKLTSSITRTVILEVWKCLTAILLPKYITMIGFLT